MAGGGANAKPANEVITDSGAAKPAIPVIADPLDPNVNPNPNPNPNPENLSTKGKAKATSKPANENEVITDSAVVPSPSACEPYREAIDVGLSRGRNAMAIWQDLVSEYGFASSYQSVQALRAQAARNANARSPRRDRHRGWPGGASRLRHRPDGARSREPQVSAHPAVRDDAGLQPQVGSSADLPLQFAHLGRAA